jgi:DNA-binding transcriptional LysR family regulator
MFQCLDRFAVESPHSHIELFETVITGAVELLTRAEVDLAITPLIPQGFFGEPLLRMRFLPVAHPDHPLHKLGRPIAQADLRAQRHLIVRESGSARTTRLSLEATQRWTVSHMATSIQAARLGYGFAWLPEERIREELSSGALAALPLPEGGERYAELYLVYADRDAAGPGALRLGDIIRETVKETCPASQLPIAAAARGKRVTPKRSGAGSGRAAAVKKG